MSYHTTSEAASPLDLFQGCYRHRLPSEVFLGTTGQVLWTLKDITHALTGVFYTVGVLPPPDGKVTSYYLFIGAHTEQVLLVIPLKARVVRFGWGADLWSMASLYFDRTIRMHAASFWLSVRGTPTVLRRSQRCRHDGVVHCFGRFAFCRLVYGNGKSSQVARKWALVQPYDSYGVSLCAIRHVVRPLQLRRLTVFRKAAAVTATRNCLWLRLSLPIHGTSIHPTEISKTMPISVLVEPPAQGRSA